MKRTTLRLPDDLLKEAKKRAADRGTSLTALVAEALREVLSRGRRGEGDDGPEPVSLTTVNGTGVQPGVDLDDTASLRDLMESADDPS